MQSIEGAERSIRTDHDASRQSNRVLRELNPNDLAQLQRHFETATHKSGAVLVDIASPVRNLWFPITAVVSVVVPSESGSGAEVGCIGCEGVVGIEGLLGENSSVARYVVQISGTLLKLPLVRAHSVMESSRSFRNLILHYLLEQRTEVMQLAACNALHSCDARLARFLLLMFIKNHQRTLSPMTHETLALMLGVQRTTVTAAAISLQKSGLIAYRRGKIIILNTIGLKAASCECYDILSASLFHAL